MGDDERASAQRRPERVVVTLSPAEREALQRLAEWRFGSNRSRAVGWAVVLAAEVLAAPATVTTVDPLEALSAYVAANK
jgi:hypothetical protein